MHGSRVESVMSIPLIHLNSDFFIFIVHICSVVISPTKLKYLSCYVSCISRKTTIRLKCKRRYGHFRIELLLALLYFILYSSCNAGLDAMARGSGRQVINLHPKCFFKQSIIHLIMHMMGNLLSFELMQSQKIFLPIFSFFHLPKL